MNYYQPFCDITLEENYCTAEEYDLIVQRIKSNANRDLKFSDTEIKITALDLHRYLNYRCKIVSEESFRTGVTATFAAVARLCVKSAIWLSVAVAIGIAIFYAWGA